MIGYQHQEIPKRPAWIVLNITGITESKVHLLKDINEKSKNNI